MFYTDEIQLKFPWYLHMHALTGSSPIVSQKSILNSKSDIDLTVLRGGDGEDEDEDDVSLLSNMIILLIFEINSLLIVLLPPWKMMMPLEGALVLPLNEDPSQIIVIGRLIPCPSNFESLCLQSELLIFK